jgi:hypothetical protein
MDLSCLLPPVYKCDPGASSGERVGTSPSVTREKSIGAVRAVLWIGAGYEIDELHDGMRRCTTEGGGDEALRRVGEVGGGRGMQGRSARTAGS